MAELHAAERLFVDIFCAAMRPPAVMTVAEWIAENVVLIDGPLAGQTWSPAGAPYLVEIANCLGDDHPCNTVTIRKSQQSGASILALAWMLYVAEREPANVLYAVPGIEALKDLNGQKLSPLIKAWERHTGRQVFAPQTSRSGAGSTTFEKKFADSYLALGNANSKMDLSSKTCKKGVKDELSKWEPLLGGEDPETLFFGRFTAFRRRKDYKILEISTPEVDTGDENGEIEGHCRIDRSFLAGDRRFWNVPCPSCRKLFVHDFARLKIDYEQPSRSRYLCNHCEYPISEAERVVAVRAGQWVPLIDEPGRQPSFHIDAFISLMMSYEAIAVDAIRAEKGSEKARKDFWNLDLGRPYKFRGDAPDHRKLMDRRETGLARGHVPARALLLVATADVQMRGIWLAVTAYAANGESWLVDARYLEGDTESPHNPVFADLRRETLDRQFPDAFGRTRSIDALGIDSGYRAHVVYSWVRVNQAHHPFTGRDVVLVLKGVDGWRAPAIGTPGLVDIDLAGQKVKQGARVWPVGTWSLKSSFYTHLHKLGIISGLTIDPPGYCHFGQWVDEGYFKQITAEHLRDVIKHGRVIGREWAKTTENHFLDCRVYADALAEYLGLSTMTVDEWAELARRRDLPDALTTPDLFTLKPIDRGQVEPSTETGAGLAAGEGRASKPLPPVNLFDAYADLNA